MKKLELDFVLFDLIGTTVRDSKNGESLILDCFYNAFDLIGYQINREILNQHRGKSKREAIYNILTDNELNIELTDKIYSDFIHLLNDSVIFFTEIEGASQVFKQLKNRQIKIGIGSGLPKEFMTSILKQVGWNSDNFDYIGSSDELGLGRPNPIMIFDSMKKLGLENKSRVLKVGDTKVDIQEGKNANVLTAMILTGTQGIKDLGNITPDYILKDINELILL